MYDVERIRADNDIIRIAENAGAQFRHVSNEYRSACPIHKGDNSSAFSVYTEGGYQHFKCFTREECGSGDVIDFVMKLYGYSFNDACEWLGGEKNADPQTIAKMAAERAAREILALEESTKKAMKVLKELRQVETWLKYHQSLDGNRDLQMLWERNGIPVEWQNYWQLGYCTSFSIMTEAGKWTTPTLTIPIFSGENWDLQNIKHRLLNPYKPGDKYRPEKPGLAASNFFCDPATMFDAERILIVEGEKKAMVTYLTLDDPEIQVIGLPGKNQWRTLTDKFHGQSVYICLDPDAYPEAVELAKLVKGRLINISQKIDDAIIERTLDKRGIRQLMYTSKKIGA